MCGARHRGGAAKRNVPTCHRVRTRDVIGRRRRRRPRPGPGPLSRTFPPWPGRADARDVQFWAPMKLRVAIIGSRARGRSPVGTRSVACSYARASARWPPAGYLIYGVRQGDTRAPG